MKNNKLSLLMLSVCVILPIAGCNKQNNSHEDESKDSGPEVITNQYIVENGTSSYYVVLPKQSMAKEKVAAQEFTYFMHQATGCDIQVITEKNVKRSYKYISLGNTTQFKNEFPDYDYSRIDGTQSSYFISTKNNNIYINSSGDFTGYGTLYGVYDLLHDLVNYTYYCDNEIYFENKETVELLKYDDKFVEPSFDSRSISTLYTMSHAVHTQRLRLLNNSRGDEWCHLCYGHGQIATFCAPWFKDENGEYLGDVHPDWFIKPGDRVPQKAGEMINNGLNWTAGEELEEYVANKMIQFIQKDSAATFFMCGQEDTYLTCNCDNCKAALAEWGGTYAGLQINFMNHVIERCEKWVQTYQPGREIQYLVFAYQSTLEPPVKKDANGKWVPYSDKVIPHKKLKIHLAPIEANYAFTFSSPINKEFGDALEGWGAIANGHIIMYLYDLNYRLYFVNFNNFGTVTGMYRECKEAGATYMLTQGVSDSNVCCFDEMRSYVESNLMWNVDASYEDLAHDFLNHYYKNVSPQLTRIYEMIRDRYAYYQTLVQQSSGSISGDLRNPNLYPYSLVRQLDNLIHEAFGVIEELRATDPDLANTLYERTVKEYLSVIYLKMMLYRSNYSEDEVNEMINTFTYYTQYFGITHSDEGKPIDGIFD